MRPDPSRTAVPTAIVGIAIVAATFFAGRLAAQDPDAAAVRSNPAVTALGRLEPKDGIIRIAGPSRMSLVIAELRVAEGDRVQAGQVLAVLDSFAIQEAAVHRLEVELANAQSERVRSTKLFKDGIVSESQRETLETRVATLKAELRGANVELEQSQVKSPVDGQVLEVHAYPGERVGPDGIVELGRTDMMYAIAEVYETDIGNVSLGQTATIKSPAFKEEMHGRVDRIGLKIGKKDVLDTDPVAQTDARVIEVDILLDDSEKVSHLTNLRVDVIIGR